MHAKISKYKNNAEYQNQKLISEALSDLGLSTTNLGPEFQATSMPARNHQLVGLS
jgi:hypothetical protein